MALKPPVKGRSLRGTAEVLEVNAGHGPQLAEEGSPAFGGYQPNTTPRLEAFPGAGRRAMTFVKKHQDLVEEILTCNGPPKVLRPLMMPTTALNRESR